MFLTFFSRMEPAESMAKPHCMRKMSAPAHMRKKVSVSAAWSAMADLTSFKLDSSRATRWRRSVVVGIVRRRLSTREEDPQRGCST